MNIKYHYIRPHSISDITHCHPIVNCCNCINECLCQSNLLIQKSALNQNTYCDTFPNKITYQISSQKKTFNPISLYSNLPKESNHLSRNDSILNNLGFRASSETKSYHDYLRQIGDNSVKNRNNYCQRNSLIDGAANANRLNSPMGVYKNKNLDSRLYGNYSNYLNNRRKNNKNNKYLNYKKKIRNLPENISGIYNEMLNKKNNNLRDNAKNLKLSHIEGGINKLNGLNRKKSNNLAMKRRMTFNSMNQSKREQSKEDQNNIEDKNKYNSETMAKIIIDKEIQNKNLEDEINKYKNNYDSLKNQYKKISKENENIKKINNDIKNEYKKYKSDLYLLKKRNEEDKEMYKDIQNKNNDLLNKIKNLKKKENNFNILNDENLELKNENKKLRNKVDSLQKDYKNIIDINDECKNNFDSILSKYNNLIKKQNDLEKENKNLKNQLLIKRMKNEKEKINDENEDINNQSKELINDNKIKLRKYKSYDEDYSLIKNKYDQLREKYNCLEKENKKLKKINEQKENEIKELVVKEDMNLRNIANLNNKINMLKIDFNEINKKYQENQNLLNEEKKRNEQNKKIITNYKNEINKLNKEIMSLNEKIKKYEKEIDELKMEKHNKKEKSLYEDEIVIINRECTFTKSDLGNEFNSSIKKQVTLSDNDIYKYHEIIQDLTNMILIYEQFFFKKAIKPKNNNELLCFMIVQYIDKKIKKIKLNAFVNLIIYKETRTPKNAKKNNYLKENIDDNANNNKNIFMKHNKYRKGYYNEK